VAGKAFWLKESTIVTLAAADRCNAFGGMHTPSSKVLCCTISR
jgi:hypothetical protein